jgi:hydroxymethylglutaryl-CoA lyase
VAAIGVCTFCPYEGELPDERTLEIVERLRSEGIDEVYLATSVGVDAPRRVHRLFSRVRERWPELRLGLHAHNTNGMALANALAAMDAGATVLEGSILGVGGGIRMPSGMAPYGNVATEDLAQMCAEMDVETGVDVAALIAAGKRIRELLGLATTYGYATAGGTKADVLALTRS